VTKRRIRALALGFLLLATGCHHAPHWWALGHETACGPEMAIRIDGQVTFIGNCAGQLVIPAKQVIVHVGDEFDVHVTQEQSGEPVLALPKPTSTVLRLVRTDNSNAVETFRAIAPGKSGLISKTDAPCQLLRNGRDRPGPCVAVDVHVIT
jgi:hypothetical protein